MVNSTTATCPTHTWDPRALELAPYLAVDDAEPFLPHAVATATVTSNSTPSPTVTGLTLTPAPGATIVVEYALWWECEIGHLYDLEHVWVHGRATTDGWKVVAVDGSAHGKYRRLKDVALHKGRPIIYLEPGKHGTAAHPEKFAAPRDVLTWLCGQGAGRGGVCITKQFEGHLHSTPGRARATRRLLREYAFVPTWSFSRLLEVRELPLVLWDDLRHQIPTIISKIVDAVPTDPLLLPGRRWDDDDRGVEDGTQVLLAAVAWTPEGWHLEGAPMSEQLKKLRLTQRDLVAFLPHTTTGEALQKLADALRAQWCLTATVVVASSQTQYTLLHNLGVTPAADYRVMQPNANHDWVVAPEPQNWATLRTIGPGGDVDVSTEVLKSFPSQN